MRTLHCQMRLFTTPLSFFDGKGQMIRDIEVPKYFYGTDRYELNSRARDRRPYFTSGAGTNNYFHQHATESLDRWKEKMVLLPKC